MYFKELHSLNTGVRTEHSCDVSTCETLVNSSRTAANASEFVNKKPRSQKAAGPTFPWKQINTASVYVCLLQ